MKKLPIMTATLFTSILALPSVATAVPQQPDQAAAVEAAALEEQAALASAEAAQADEAIESEIDGTEAVTDSEEIQESTSEDEATGANPAGPAPAMATPTSSAPTEAPEMMPNQQHSAPNYQPLIQGEVTSESANPDQAAAITLQEKKKDRRGELVATQPGQVEFKESRHIQPR